MIVHVGLCETAREQIRMEVQACVSLDVGREATGTWFVVRKQLLGKRALGGPGRPRRRAPAPGLAPKAPAGNPDGVCGAEIRAPRDTTPSHFQQRH